MKRLLLTVIAALALCGSVSAQLPAGQSNWDEFYFRDYSFNKPVVAYFRIDGELLTADDYWGNNLEFCPMVNGELRGNGYYQTWDYDPEWDYAPECNITVYHTATGEPITFQMYDHNTGTLYTECFVSFWADIDTPVTLYTGTFYDDLYFGDDELTVVLNFTSPASTGIDKEIIGYDAEGVDDRWYFLSSPVGTVDIVNDANEPNIANLFAENYDFFAFDQNEHLEWRNYKLGEFSQMEVGHGYLYARKYTGTITFPGEAYTGEGTFPLLYNEAAEMPGYNLMGNPYNTEATVEGDIEFLVIEEADVVPATSRTVGPMEGILAVATSADASITFTPVVTGDKAAGLVMNVSDGRKTVDRAIVRFGQGRQLPKYQLREESTKLYIPVDGEDFAVVRSEGMGELPVSFKAEKSGSYTLGFSAEQVSFAYLHLIDNMTGADVDLLATPSYSFDASTTDYASRFKLVFATGDSADGDNFAFFSNGSFVINNTGDATVQVVDVTGRILSSEAISGCATVSVDGAAGVYMIRLINGENVKVQKVVVK